MYFFCIDGLHIPKNKVLTKSLPTMIPLGGLAEKLLDAGPGLTATSQAFMVGNLVLNLFMSASLNYMLSMLNVYQIILMMPLFMISIPGNTQFVFGFFQQIAAFDILPMDEIYEGFGFTKTDPVDDNLDALGYGTTLLLYNVGSLILPIISYPVMLIIYAVF